MDVSETSSSTARRVRAGKEMVEETGERNAAAEIQGMIQAFSPLPKDVYGGSAVGGFRVLSGLTSHVLSLRGACHSAPAALYARCKRPDRTQCKDRKRSHSWETCARHCGCGSEGASMRDMGRGGSDTAETGEALQEGLATARMGRLRRRRTGARCFFALRLRSTTWLFCDGIGPESEDRPAGRQTTGGEEAFTMQQQACPSPCLCPFCGVNE